MADPFVLAGLAKIVKNKQNRKKLQKQRDSVSRIIASRSPVAKPFRGNPFFDPWAKGGKFNK